MRLLEVCIKPLRHKGPSEPANDLMRILQDVRVLMGLLRPLRTSKATTSLRRALAKTYLDLGNEKDQLSSVRLHGFVRLSFVRLGFVELSFVQLNED